MSNETAEQEPTWGMKGRDFIEDAQWLFAVIDGKNYYLKAKKEEVIKAFMGEMFEAYHVLSVGGPIPLYLPATARTLEPWHLCGARCSALAGVHPDFEQYLDAYVKKGVRSIEVVENGPVVAAKAPGPILLP